METEHPTVAAVIDAYGAVADRHDQAAELHARAYDAAAPKVESPASASGLDSGPSDD